MAKTYTSMIQLQKDMEKRISIAIKQTADIVKEKLYECVNVQYYNDPGFHPNVYERTETFLNSVTMALLSPTSAEVFIDVDGMHYKTGINPWEIVSWASNSMHGGEMYQTDTTSFWDEFIAWCDKNLLVLLKANLRKCGINVQ